MSLLGKLFGRKTAAAVAASSPAATPPATPPPPPTSSPSAPADPAKNPNMIPVFDAYGREMFIDGNLHLCLSEPRNPTARILLLQTCLSMKRVRPAIVAEYREKLERLQRENPLADPAQGVLQRLFTEVYP